MSANRAITFWSALALAVAFVWAPVPAAQAAKATLITLSADKQNVNAGDNDTLHIRLENVKSATLDGEALKGNKIDRKVQVCETTTYTLFATTNDGKSVAQLLTVTATGTSTQPACLPDLAVESMRGAIDPPAYDDSRQQVNFEWIIRNRGKTTSPPIDVSLSSNQQNSFRPFQARSLKPGEAESGSAPVDGLFGTTATLFLVLDPKHKVAESDKTNNTGFASVNIPAEQTAPKNAPLAPGINLPGLSQP